MPKQSTHPSREELNAYSLGELPEDKAVAIDSHISECRLVCVLLAGFIALLALWLVAENRWSKRLRITLGLLAILTVELSRAARCACWGVGYMILAGPEPADIKLMLVRHTKPEPGAIYGLVEKYRDGGEGAATPGHFLIDSAKGESQLGLEVEAWRAALHEVGIDKPQMYKAQMFGPIR